MSSPLADRIRPKIIDDVVGQKHILSDGMMLRRIIESEKIPNMIFYGPSGTGKTTVANIIASKAGKTLHKLNATTASVSDIKDIISSLNGFMEPDGVILYLDEIQHFNKKQQQTLLEYMENGKITLIASTTENPYFYVYNAVLSRSVIFEFRPVEAEEIVFALKKCINVLSENEYKHYKLKFDETALFHIASIAGGDVRRAINSLEICMLAAVPDKDGVLYINNELAEQATQRKSIKYDRDGDSHYNILSAFQKSIRGSDPDAAIHYLARLVSAGDLQSIVRRLMVIASEDIGLAYPMAAVIVKSCVDSALQLGFPEAQIPLAEAVILLATAPKSNSANEAICAALADISSFDVGEIPDHLKDAHYEGAKTFGHGLEYKYPHSYENNYVEQQYLPDNIKDRKYYIYGENKTEQLTKSYWDKIKGNK